MASNDSGVDTSNDSSCTNDNSNNTSINYVLVPSENANAVVLDGLRQVAHKLSVLKSSPSERFRAEMGESTSTYKIPSTHVHINKMSSRASSNALARRCQHRPSTRNALIPYVCTVPNERKLRLAASVSNVELLVRLLDSGVNPNTSDEHQRSPLHLAASRGKQINCSHQRETSAHLFLRYRLQRRSENTALSRREPKRSGFTREYSTPFGHVQRKFL